MTDFNFGTKAETLELIKKRIKHGIIPEQLFFSVKEWDENQEGIINKIQSLSAPGFLVVRSSSINEDAANSSNAGRYTTILDVKKEDPLHVKNAVEEVKKSYFKDHELNFKDQILIQPQLENISMSGVILTRCSDTGAPYIIINYDDSSGRTDTVTSGNSSTLKTFSYFKYLDKLPSDKRLSLLINASRELEKITGLDSLDIEFAINGKGLYILQVRPITTIKNIAPSLDENISKTIEVIKEYIRCNDKKFPNLCGYKAIFGSMPDWNPAEIIGESPKPLAFSLYKEIITDYIWPLSRKEIGYRDVGYHPGIVSFGGKPYVDVRLSFNTFVPASISETTAEKLVNYYIDKLINNPEMHDKVEFEIALTCHTFDFDNKIEELRRNNFSNLQIKEIKESLLNLTNKIVSEKNTTIGKELSLSKILNEKRDKIVGSDILLDIKIAQLIHDCKYYGTLPFCKLARFAFIGNTLINSLVNLGIIGREEKNNLLQSINSIAAEFLRKLELLKNQNLTKQEFLKEFGHLRPGTYDLCSPTYNEFFDEYVQLDNVSAHQQAKEFCFDPETIRKIEILIQKENFDFSAEQFLNFTKTALAAREKSKFEFTKNLNLILEYSYEHLKKYGLAKEDVTFLDINDIVSFSHKSKPITELEDLKDKIERSRKQYEITKSLRLPPLIYLEKNVEYFHQFDNRPNYITTELIVGDVIYLDEKTEPKQIKNKIVLITNADPGFDWIFGHNIQGLITKYGGIASHMAIRCAEFNLPAAIGCGETIFDYIKKFRKIELNCEANLIKGIS
ncbi:MAG: PEP/pyruvate-binding domain-containing protein [Nanoarchaeota archaeon]